MLSSKPKTRAKRILLIIMVNLVIVIYLIAIIEYISFALLKKEGGARFGENLVQHPYLNHVWKPNFSLKHTEWIADNPDFPKPYVQYYNSQSWLEKYDVTKEKPPNTYRIFYLGDSFTEGTCAMDESVPGIVEKKLNELAENMNLRFEVINAGTSSYSPILYYLAMRHMVVNYSPDLVVVNVDMSDDFDDWKYRQTLILDDAGDPLAAPPRNIYSSVYVDAEYGAEKMTLLRKLQIFLLKNSHTFNLILEQRKRRNRESKSERKEPSLASNSKADVYQRYSWCQKEWDEATEENVAFSLAVLKKLALFCQKRNIKIMFNSVPQYWQYFGKQDFRGEPFWSSRPHYEIASLAKSINVPYLNSFERLKPLIRNTRHAKYYLNNNLHFNPRGYKIWGNDHLRFLLDRRNALLPTEFYANLEGESGNR